MFRQHFEFFLVLLPLVFSLQTIYVHKIPKISITTIVTKCLIPSMDTSVTVRLLHANITIQLYHCLNTNVQSAGNYYGNNTISISLNTIKDGPNEVCDIASSFDVIVTTWNSLEKNTVASIFFEIRTHHNSINQFLFPSNFPTKRQTTMYQPVGSAHTPAVPNSYTLQPKKSCNFQEWSTLW